MRHDWLLVATSSAMAVKMGVSTGQPPNYPPKHTQYHPGDTEINLAHLPGLWYGAHKLSRASKTKHLPLISLPRSQP